ncbi:MAG: transketolase, partial [Chloroflexi bacterium]|nr:transketolase [Chloroflexota bacterium]
ALDAAGLLEEADIRARVVSIPCWELFEAQDQAYRESVLPSDVACRVSVEAGATLGWSRYIGDGGIAIGIDRFGASAPYAKIYEEFGLTPGHVAEAVNALLAS